MWQGADTKIELGLSMTLAQATPGIRPEGRRLGTLRLGSRLETQKIGLNPRAKASKPLKFQPSSGPWRTRWAPKPGGTWPKGPMRAVIHVLARVKWLPQRNWSASKNAKKR